MANTNNLTQQPTTDPTYRIDNSFYVGAYNKWEHYDDSYVSLVWEGKFYPVYNTFLYEFLTSESVALAHGLYLPDQTINGMDYINSYLEGYRAGEVDFDKSFSAGAFQGVNADAFVNSLHRKCFHWQNDVLDGDGWIEAGRQIPYLIDHSTIKYFGFFNAKLAGYDQIVNDYEELFEKLVKCDICRDGSTQKIPPTTIHGNNLEDKKPQKVFIIPEYREKLYDELKPYVEVKDRLELSKLIIDRLTPQQPIPLGCQQNVLGAIFYPYVENKRISGGAKHVSAWLVNHFQRIYGKPFFTQSVLEKHLQGQNLPNLE